MADAMARDLRGYGRRRPLAAWPGALHGLLKQSADTLILEQGCAGAAGHSSHWKRPRESNSRRITSSLCSGLISDRDNRLSPRKRQHFASVRQCASVGLQNRRNGSLRQSYRTAQLTQPTQGKCFGRQSAQVVGTDATKAGRAIRNSSSAHGVGHQNGKNARANIAARSTVVAASSGSSRTNFDRPQRFPASLVRPAPKQPAQAACTKGGKTPQHAASLMR
jgi:hypothetical protein